MRKPNSCTIVALAALFVLSCGDDDEGEKQLPLTDEAGFVELEPVEFSLQKGDLQFDLSSSKARLWYAFQTADEDPMKKPLAVFFNGGPGSTSMDNFTMNTARYTVDPAFNGGQIIGLNPNRWTSIANLLYIDAREAGFSYNETPNAGLHEVRKAEYGAQNFNPYLDAADFIRVLLRFFESHPQLRANPVIIVGESYGGIRSTAMLHILLNYRSYGDGSEVYRDPALVEEIQAHYEMLYPDYAGKAVPADVIAKQFGRQVLIQGLVSGYYEVEAMGEIYEAPGSVIFQLAGETGTTYTPCPTPPGDCDPWDNAHTFVTETAGRDIYDYTRPDGWLLNVFEVATAKLLDVDVLSTAIGMDSRKIAELYATNRTDAYRLIDLPAAAPARTTAFFARNRQTRPARSLLVALRRRAQIHPPQAAEQENLEQIFGKLKEWDAYFHSLNYDVLNAFYENEAVVGGIDELDPFSDRFGEMFLENLINVRTFMTNSSHDLILYAPSIPPALRRHTAVVESLDWDQDSGGERSGRMIIDYVPNAFPGKGPVGSRVVRFPIYDRSPHSVAVIQPDDFLEDVRTWLAEVQAPAEDGSTVVGFITSGERPEAFRRTEKGGPRGRGHFRNAIRAYASRVTPRPARTVGPEAGIVTIATQHGPPKARRAPGGTLIQYL